MKRIECEGVGDNDGFFEIGAEVGVSETAGCSTAELRRLWRMTARRPSGGRLGEYHQGYDKAMLEMRIELAALIKQSR